MDTNDHSMNVKFQAHTAKGGPTVGKIALLGLLVEERAAHAPEMQEVITRYGSIIFGRMGTPTLDKHNGIISLHVGSQ